VSCWPSGEKILVTEYPIQFLHDGIDSLLTIVPRKIHSCVRYLNQLRILDAVTKRILVTIPASITPYPITGPEDSIEVSQNDPGGGGKQRCLMFHISPQQSRPAGVLRPYTKVTLKAVFVASVVTSHVTH
jgi:hypothetical protein